MISVAKIPTGHLWRKTTTSTHPISCFSLCSYNQPVHVYFSINKKSRRGFLEVKNGSVISYSEELSTGKCKRCNEEELELVHTIDDFSDINESTTSMILTKKNLPPPSKSRDLIKHFHRQLSITLLCGLFVFQDHPLLAVAATNIPTQLETFSFFGDLDDISTGFASGFLLIFFSELGDKTFFIAALLAARNSPAVIFLGTFGALAVMSVVSVVLGRTFHYIDDILPFRFGDTDLPLDDVAAVCLLVYFGVTTLLEASSSDGLKAEEEQKEAEVAVSKFSGDGAGILASASTVISTFVLVFVAEWGDKSFFSTIALAAASSPLGVIGGALAGHGVATLLAVLGGSLLGTLLSEKVIAYIGGSLFLVFAVITLIEIVS